jgi:hypothetical protein
VELEAVETAHSVFLEIKQVQYLNRVFQTPVVAEADMVAVALEATVAQEL